MSASKQRMRSDLAVKMELYSFVGLPSLWVWGWWRWIGIHRGGVRAWAGSEMGRRTKELGGACREGLFGRRVWKRWVGGLQKGVGLWRLISGMILWCLCYLWWGRYALKPLPRPSFTDLCFSASRSFWFSSVERGDEGNLAEKVVLHSLWAVRPWKQ